MDETDPVDYTDVVKLAEDAHDHVGRADYEVWRNLPYVAAFAAMARAVLAGEHQPVVIVTAVEAYDAAARIERESTGRRVAEQRQRDEERRATRSVPCPTCDAPVGLSCRNSSGRVALPDGHPERFRAARSRAEGGDAA